MHSALKLARSIITKHDLQLISHITFPNWLELMMENLILGFKDQRTGTQLMVSPRKQPTFGDATTGFPAKWHLRNERRNSILMTPHYPDLCSAFDWSCRVGNLIQPIRSTTQIWVMRRHQYWFSALISQTSFGSLQPKPVVASPNVGCFLMLIDGQIKTVSFPQFKSKLKQQYLSVY